MPDPISVAFVSLGCAKNLVDCENILGHLAEAGGVITADEADADAVVINTCGFLEASRAEAENVIREVISQRQRSRRRRVVVAESSAGVGARGWRAPVRPSA